jgi:hypothetical protein
MGLNMIGEWIRVVARHQGVLVMFNSILSIQYFDYLSSELNSQWQITESARIQTTAIRQHRTKQTRKQRKVIIIKMIIIIIIIIPIAQIKIITEK